LKIGSTTVVSLNNVEISNMVGASFSADGKKALVLFGSAGAVKGSVFDIPTETWQALAGTYDDAAWAPQGSSRLVSVAPGTQGGTVVTLTTFPANAALKPTAQVVATLRAQDMRLAWKGANALVLYDRPTAYGEGTAWSLDLGTKNIVPLIRETLGMDLIWNPVRGNGVVFKSTVTNKGGMLTAVNGAGVQTAQFNFLTLPAKCSFVSPASTTGTASAATGVATATSTSNYIACGVPADQDKLTISPLPDRYYQKAFFTSDRLVVIDLNTQGIVFVGTTNEAVDATNLKIANGKLYFLNRYNDGLYAVPYE
jgi:hypothetical protein